jgi:hypothetical protein
MLDFIGTIAIAATILLCFVAIGAALPLRTVPRVVLALVVGIWIGLAAAIGAAGEFADAGQRPVPLIGVFFATPLVAAALFAVFSPAARKAMLALPMPLMIGLNIPRFVGGMFLLLAAAGRLGGPFPHSAAWGDIVTAVVAIPAIWWAVRPSSMRDRWIWLWNAFGALDLFVAVGLATLTTPGSPLRLIEGGVGPQAMQFLPWVLIPTVLVPFWLIQHGIIFAQLRARARDPRPTAGAAAMREAA